MQKYEPGPVRSMADVDAELALLQTYDIIKKIYYFILIFIIF
jgi:hypothetical protein